MPAALTRYPGNGPRVDSARIRALHPSTVRQLVAHPATHDHPPA
ncbi:hypothetical protein ACFVY1_35380 [Streptomyces sp. NPDC058293]